jgi:hypothetical protein
VTTGPDAVNVLKFENLLILNVTDVPMRGNPFDKRVAVSVGVAPEPHTLDEVAGESTIVGGAAEHPLTIVSSQLIVTAPVLASARPSRAPPLSVMLA